MAHRILILGGTSEARALTDILAGRGGLDIILSLAGRTKNPLPYATQMRIGGFGGAQGLATFLREQRIDALVDATHPYATQISMNAIAAADAAGVMRVRLQRPEWRAIEGDTWLDVGSVAEAAASIGAKPRVVFVALGRQELAPLIAAPQHRYIIRSVDPVTPPLNVPDARYILARGPFRQSAEYEMLAEHNVDCMIAKNSGGDATYGKIAAARALQIPVLLIRRAPLFDAFSVDDVDRAVALIDHGLSNPLRDRGE